jgi:hypothetical protein
MRGFIEARRQQLGTVQALINLLKPSIRSGEVLQEVIGDLDRALDAALDSLEAYTNRVADLQTWGNIDWAMGQWPAAAVARLWRAKEDAAGLRAWVRFSITRTSAIELGVSELLAAVDDGRLLAQALIRGFDYVFYRSLSQGLMAEHKVLARFSGIEHERVRVQFATMDRQILVLNGARHAARADAAKKPIPGVLKGELTEMALLAREIRRSKRHLPILTLLQRAGHSVQAFKPCFMMSPSSGARYLPSELIFDLVVMDDAVQLRTQDAFGALKRASQWVVVGDPQQLGPATHHDEAETESVLGLCQRLGLPVRTLRRHYRARHPSLIAFSNAAFYDHQLLVFPSPYERPQRLGTHFHFVCDGLYQVGRNVAEARRVVDSVVEHVLTNPDQALGVIAFSRAQCDLIETLLDQRLRRAIGGTSYLERHDKAGRRLFVKLPTDVQGDEREVILVSVTFGRLTCGGGVPQDFGCLDEAEGWRYINVLTTRASCRLDLYASMLPSDVLINESTGSGPRALREFLAFAQTGVLTERAEKLMDLCPPESDFQRVVTEVLHTHGYETVLRVGVAGVGCYIDLGVRDPDRPGEFLAGIECDGESYYSMTFARDRDRIRQEVLEAIGWRDRLLRMWSPDWFNDSAAQTDRLLRYLEQRRGRASRWRLQGY